MHFVDALVLRNQKIKPNKPKKVNKIKLAVKKGSIKEKTLSIRQKSHKLQLQPYLMLKSMKTYFKVTRNN